MMEKKDLPNREWHIIYTNPRSEKRVKEYLNRYKIECYLPLLKIKSRWKDRWKEIEKPLFTSYIFVRISFWEERKKVIILPGVHHIVFYKGAPATVTQDDLDMIELFTVNFAESLKVEKEDTLQPGRIVNIKYGILAGKVATIVEQKNKTYVVVNLPMMGQSVRAEVKIEDLGLEELKI
jgi:transcription antitermination factor NusG